MPTRLAAQLAVSPIRRAAFGLLVAGAAFILPPRGYRWIGIFVAVCVYSLADPAINAFKPRWWVNAGKSLVGFLVLLVAAGFMSDTDKLGEAGMLFVVPMMIYPFALGISGLIYLLRWNLPPK